MARFCRSFDSNSDEGDAKISEKHGDSAELSFESLVESTPVSNSRPYSAVHQNSSRNTCTIDGLRFCTESLGFESSDEREDCICGSFEDAEFDRDDTENDCRTELDGAAMKDCGIRRAPGHMKGACFPPPLSSMGPHGQPSVFLKPLRKDGRFLLQEVSLPRHERLHAWRQDGRLRLQLVPPSPSREAEECGPGSDTSASSKGESEKLVASLEEERVHVDCFREGSATDVSLARYQEALGRRCQRNTKCMASTWKPRCITT